MKRLVLGALVCLVSLAFAWEYAQGWDPPLEVDLYHIKFDYQSGSTNDALTLSDVTVPEWAPGISRNDTIAYIKSQTSRQVQADFGHNQGYGEIESMHIYANEHSGTGIGSLDTTYVEFYASPGVSPYTNFTTTGGSVPSSVGTRSFQWSWKICKVNGESVSPHIGIDTTGSHCYYTALDDPVSPMQEPTKEVLGYACDWASGQSTNGGACTAILSNGFSDHYTWDMNCDSLSSDFVRLATSLGISASLHLWSKHRLADPDDPEPGDMVEQKTKSIDPVGSTYGQGEIVWGWHQWADAASSQRDPSTATSKSGNWGDYEDDLFKEYGECTYWQNPNSYGFDWVENQNGQTVGCEHDTCRYYSNTPTIHPWRGPDR